MNKEKILTEIQIKAVRSSGAGGQNVNKVSSKAVLSFDLLQSQGLSTAEKELLQLKMASRLTSAGVLLLNCDEDRSQLRNKELVIKRFLYLLETNLLVDKERKATKIPKSVIRKRIQEKRNHSEKKQFRKRPDF